MIITCPDCETQFLVNNADIAPDGRDVRCSRCDYQWYVAPDPNEDVAPEAPDETEAAEEAPKEDEQPAVPPVGEAAIEESVSAAAPAQTVRDMVPDASAAITPDDDYQSRLPVPVSVRGPGWRLLVSLILLLAVAAVSGGLFMERARVIDAWPPARAVYEKLNLIDPLPQQSAQPNAPAVQLRDVRLSGSEDALMLTGLIIGQPDYVLTAQLSLRVEDAEGNGLYQAVVGRSDLVDDPQGMRFSVQLPALPATAHGLVVSLD